MKPVITVKQCVNEGLENLKDNFWDYVFIIIILGIFVSMGNGGRFGNVQDGWGFPDLSDGLIITLITFFIKPVFEYGASLQFIRGNRGEPVDVKGIVQGFKSKELYIDIILANAIFFTCVFFGFIALIIPGIYIICRLIFTSYLVMDKDLAPQQAIKASWELTRDYWTTTLALMTLAAFMFMVGLLLLVVGVFPALIWIKGMFASFYQQIIDIHEEDFLLSLDIEP